MEIGRGFKGLAPKRGSSSLREPNMRHRQINQFAQAERELIMLSFAKRILEADRHKAQPHWSP